MNQNFSQQDGQIRIRPSIFTPHPAGIANVTITNIELAESTIEGWAPRLCFDLESDLADERGQPRLLRSYVSTTFSPGNKLEAVVVGKSCILLLAQTDGGKWRVIQVLPLPSPQLELGLEEAG